MNDKVRELRELVERIKAHFSAAFIAGNIDGEVNQCMGSTMTGPYGGDEVMTLERIRNTLDAFLKSPAASDLERAMGEMPTELHNLVCEALRVESVLTDAARDLGVAVKVYQDSLAPPSDEIRASGINAPERVAERMRAGADHVLSNFNAIQEGRPIPQAAAPPSDEGRGIPALIESRTGAVHSVSAGVAAEAIKRGYKLLEPAIPPAAPKDSNSLGLLTKPVTADAKAVAAVAPVGEREEVARWFEAEAAAIDHDAPISALYGAPHERIMQSRAAHYRLAASALRSIESSEGADLKAKYYELLYEVGIKHPNETRHETALRYIRQAEQSNNPTAAALGVKP